MSLNIKNLSCGYQNKAIIENITLQVNVGEIACILGANGVGKTTFFKTVQGFLQPIDGAIFWKDMPMHEQDNKKRAKVIAYVPQTHTPPFPYRVRDVVVMGRAVHLKSFQSPNKNDYIICDHIMEKLNIAYLSSKIYSRISGGERQMVLIARALAQEPELLMMDEPTSNLDFGNQARVLQQIVDLAREGLTVMMTTHSPEHASMYADKVVLFQRNKPILMGKPNDILTKETLEQVYGVDIKLLEFENNYGKQLKTCVPMMKG